MGEHDQKKANGATQAGPAQGDLASPGKQTLTGAGDAAAEGDAENDRLQRPPRYAHLDIDIVDLLWKSRETYFAKEHAAKLPFWKMVDTVGAPGLQTLVQIHKRTQAAGVWGAIQHLAKHDEGIYTYGSSWGIHFNGDVSGLVTNGSWGKDLPQGPVQDEHGAHGKEFTWYRQNSGAGNPGLHIGIGSGNLANVHVDPTNPMDHVSSGVEFFGLMPVPVPKGSAIYSPAALAEHLKDIWNIGDPVEHAATPQPFLSISQLDYCAGVGGEIADLERGAKVKPQNVARRDAACAKVKSAIPMVKALLPKSRELAMQDTGKNAGAVNQLKTEFLAARHVLFEGLANLFAHLHTDIEGIMPNKRVLGVETDWDEKRNMMGYAMDKYKEYAAQRTWNDPNAKLEDL